MSDRACTFSEAELVSELVPINVALTDRFAGPEISYAFMGGYLYTPEPNRLIYYFEAQGVISDLSIRSSPDLKWINLENIYINGKDRNRQEITSLIGF